MQQKLFNEEQYISEKPYLNNISVNSSKNIKIVDLFAGVGGFHYGIKSSASKINYDVKSIVVSEIEKSCKETYLNNFSGEVEGDINNIDLQSYNETSDILTAGFPCQPFSNSGLKLGLTDPRGQFYFKIEEFIKHFKTKSFILENVPGIKRNGGGSYISKLSNNPQTIGATMKYLEDNLIKLKDYTIKWIELDSSLFGSPQVRKRVYIIGIHKDFTENFDLKFNNFKRNSFINISDRIKQKDLELSKNQNKNLLSFMNKAPNFKNGMRRVGQAYLCKGGNVGQGYHSYGLVPTLTKVWARFLPIYFPHQNENIPDINDKNFKTNKYYGKGYFRKASIREVYRLQGFPDQFKPNSNKNLAYEHAGNAVNAKVVREISNIILTKILN